MAGRRGLTTAFALLAAAGAVIVARTLQATATSARTWGMFPPTTAYVLGTLGLAMLAACLLHAWLDGRPGDQSSWMRITGAMSRHSLSLYLLHHVAHVWPLWAWGGMVSDDPTIYWQVAMPVPAAIACAVVFLIGAAWLSVRMDRPGGHSAESTLRWLCEP